MTTLDAEQKEIVEKIAEKCPDKAKEWNKFQWNKFSGDVTCRIIKSFMEKHLPKHTKITDPNAFIMGLPYEFDLLIVEENAKPEELTHCFESRTVKALIEIKKRGVFSLKDADKIKKVFDEANSKFPQIKCVYLAVEEVRTTKKRNAIKFYDECKKKLPRCFFALRDSRGNKELIKGEWEAFLKYVSFVNGT
jgi:hypothetical protein